MLLSKVGRYKIYSYISDYFSLDGGSMFGSVPKTLWSRAIAPDERNRILMCARLLVLVDQESSRKLIIDTGMGRRWKDKEIKIYNIKYEGEGELSEKISGVTDILLTHLHFDHCSGAVKEHSEGLSLVYPQAKHFLTKRQLEHSKYDLAKDRASYFADNIKMIESADVHFTTDGEEILPGVFSYHSFGHTYGMQWFLIKGSNGECLAFAADLIPLSQHIPLRYIMGYDLDSQQTLEEKNRFLKQACKDDWTIFFGHDASVAAGKIGIDDRGRYYLKQKVEISNYDEA